MPLEGQSKKANAVGRNVRRRRSVRGRVRENAARWSTASFHVLRQHNRTEFRGNRTCLPMDSGLFSCPMSACSPTRFALLPHRLRMKTIRARFNTKFPARLKSEPISRVSLRRPHLTCRFTPWGERGGLKLDGIFVVRESAGLR